MEFKKYPSIENTYQADTLQAIADQGFGEAEYLVQEKIHGANLSFFTDGVAVSAAKRTEPVAEEESFYNAIALRDQHRQRMLDLFSALNAESGAKQITVFGELFGGGYPHPGVPRDESAQLVQQGIYYHPGNQFIAYDILLDAATFLDADATEAWLSRFGFLYARTLYRGSLTACLAYPNEFKTTLPAAFGLPELDGNTCEGVVIRPVQPLFFRSGSRVILKNKNERWSENNKYIDRALLRALMQTDNELSEAAQVMCEEIFKFVHENRLTNLLSKMGPVDLKKDLGRLQGMFNKDVLEDFLKVHHAAFGALEKAEGKSVTKFLNTQAAKLIRDYFGV